jgi:hypothetical protein
VALFINVQDGLANSRGRAARSAPQVVYNGNVPMRSQNVSSMGGDPV